MTKKRVSKVKPKYSGTDLTAASLEKALDDIKKYIKDQDDVMSAYPEKYIIADGDAYDWKEVDDKIDAYESKLKDAFFTYEDYDVGATVSGFSYEGFSTSTTHGNDRHLNIRIQRAFSDPHDADNYQKAVIQTITKLSMDHLVYMRNVPICEAKMEFDSDLTTFLVTARFTVDLESEAKGLSYSFSYAPKPT